MSFGDESWHLSKKNNKISGMYYLEINKESIPYNYIIIRYHLLPNSTALKLCNPKIEYIADQK